MDKKRLTKSLESGSNKDVSPHQNLPYLKSNLRIDELRDRSDWQQALVELAFTNQIDKVMSYFPKGLSKQKQNSAIVRFFTKEPYVINGTYIYGAQKVVEIYKNHSHLNDHPMHQERFEIFKAAYLGDQEASIELGYPIGVFTRTLENVMKNENFAMHWLAFYPEFPENLPPLEFNSPCLVSAHQDQDQTSNLIPSHQAVLEFYQKRSSTWISFQEAGKRLGLAPKTVSNYLRLIIETLGTNCPIELSKGKALFLHPKTTEIHIGQK